MKRAHALPLILYTTLQIHLSLDQHALTIKMKSTEMQITQHVDSIHALNHVTMNSADSANSVAFLWWHMWLRLMYMWSECTIIARVCSTCCTNLSLPWSSYPNAASSERSLHYHFLEPLFMHYDISSEYSEIVMWLRPFGIIVECCSKKFVWVSSKKGNFAESWLGNPRALSTFSPREKLISCSSEEIWWAYFIPDCMEFGLHDVA